MSVTITRGMAASATYHDPAFTPVPIKAWGWHWHVMPRWTSMFSGPQPQWWDNTSAGVYEHGIHVIKQHDLRTVFSTRLQNLAVVIKHYHPARGLHRLKQVMRGIPARHEFAAAVVGLRHELPTVRPVAWGSRHPHSDGCSMLITEEIPDAVTLSLRWAECTDRRQLSDAVARFVSCLHEARFVPFDLHPDNIVVSYGRLILVDVYKARQRSVITRALRVGNLADLHQWFQRHASRSLRLRFLHAYLQRSGLDDRRGYAVRVIRETCRRQGRLERHRDRRIFGDNRYFGILELGSWRAHVYLQSKHAIAGATLAGQSVSKSEWRVALNQVLQSTSPQEFTSLQLGGTRVAVRVEIDRGGHADLRVRFLDAYRRIHRHQASTLPLALLERGDGPESERILITERSPENEPQPHQVPDR